MSRVDNERVPPNQINVNMEWGNRSGAIMKKSMLFISGFIFSAYVVAGTNPSPHDQLEMQKHLKVARHAVAQPAVNTQKEVDKKTAQTK